MARGPERADGDAVRRAWLLLVLAAAVALTSCASRTRTGNDEMLLDEGVIACESLLRELAAIDSETASEAELVSAMQRADAGAEACDERFRRNAQDAGDQLLFAHRSDQLRLFSLFFEAALSRRFDNFEAYCTILGDLVRILVNGIAAERTALESGTLSDADQRKVRELLQLDIQTLEVVSVQVGARCSAP